MAFSDPISNGLDRPYSIVLFRWIGYCLLLLTLLDLVVVLIPLDLMNPEWEFQAMGAIIERVPVPLLGIGLIFFGDVQLRKRWELVFLKLLSWFCLVLAMVCLIVIPLVLATSAQRLTIQIDQSSTSQLNQQLEQTITLEEQLAQASRDEIAAFLESRGTSLEGTTPEQARQELIESLSSARQEATNKVKGELSTRHLNLKKIAAKWIFGSMLSGFTFAYIWWLTGWARRLSFKGVSRKQQGY
ncbi:MAG: HpsJ family protein [Microcoleaceae cyanobacterium]